MQKPTILCSDFPAQQTKVNNKTIGHIKNTTVGTQVSFSRYEKGFTYDIIVAVASPIKI